MRNRRSQNDKKCRSNRTQSVLTAEKHLITSEVIKYEETPVVEKRQYEAQSQGKVTMHPQVVLTARFGGMSE